MKSMAELPLIGLIGTMTIMASIIIPPTIVKTALDQELGYTYDYEKSQNALLSLLYSKEGGVSNYEQLGTSYVLNQPIGGGIQNQLETLVGSEYSVVISDVSDGSVTPLVADPDIQVGSEVPVLVLKYFPMDSTKKRLDSAQTGGRADTLETIRLKVDTATAQGISAMTKASIYKGYKNSNVQPYLRYYIFEEKEFLTNIPKSSEFPPFADHEKVLSDLNICDYIDRKGVKQVWIWMWHTKDLVPLESNMAMGMNSKEFWNFEAYGDVSNSFRQNDLPACQNTYTVFEYNSDINLVGEGLGGVMEDHGHQIEHILNWVDGRDDTPKEKWGDLLFWGEFVGSDSSHKIVNPGCGWTHYSPNSIEDYDWQNENDVLSDCENWKPDGTAQKTTIDCHEWYGKNCKDDGGAAWKKWWMQNIPGKDNGLIYNERKLRNWWEFIGDFDSALDKGKNLLGESVSLTPLTTGGYLLTGESSEYSSSITGKVTTPPISSGICALAIDGSCTSSNLQTTCFSGRELEASQICKAESGGNPESLSRSDVCQDGTPFSIGLFQINLVCHGTKVDPECQGIFDVGCGELRYIKDRNVYNCRLIDKSKYDMCVQKLKDASANIQVACQISNNGNNWCPWTAAKVCGFCSETGTPARPPASSTPGKTLLGNEKFSRVVFNTVFVVPFNSESLVKIMRIGLA